MTTYYGKMQPCLGLSVLQIATLEAVVDPGEFGNVPDACEKATSRRQRAAFWRRKCRSEDS
jgi:hypothetical protein